MPARPRRSADAIAPHAIHTGDNLAIMQRLPDGCCDLIYLDPPYFTNQPRRTPAGRHAVRKQNRVPLVSDTRETAYDDRWPDGLRGYLAFMQPRLEQCRRLLPDHGSLYLHADWRAVHHLRIMLDDVFGAKNFLNEIIWHYRTGGVATRWFGRKHDTILVYAKRRGRHRFHALRGGAYRTDGLNHDETGRPFKNTRRGRLYFHREGPMLTDVWDIPFLSTVSRERVAWPTQKPLALLERIIQASSNPGDRVADFFCGSGTTLVAARRLGRRFIGCDLAARAVAIVRQRLRATDAATSRPSPIERKAAPARRPGRPPRPPLSGPRSG